MPSKICDSIMNQSSPYIVSPKFNHTHTLIFLHGRESTASEFSSDLFESQASNSLTLPEAFPNLKWVFPNSGTHLCSRFNIQESQWFDMHTVQNSQERSEIQVDGLRESISLILDIIRTETAYVPPSNIILGGISQGCATAIHALLYGGIRLGGFIGLSSWLPLQEEINTLARFSASNTILLERIRELYQPEPNSPNGSKFSMPIPLSEIFTNEDRVFETPIFLAHARDDTIVAWKHGDMLWWRLEEDLGFDVDWRVYADGGHWVNEPRGVDDIIAFLQRIMI